MIDYVYIDELQVSVREIVGLGSPAPRRVVIERASRHGARDLTKNYGGRVVDLNGIIFGTASAAWAAFDPIKAKLQLGAFRTLKFRRTGQTEDEQMLVKVASPVDYTTAFDRPGVIEWGVSLFSEDPRIYGAVLRSGQYDPAASVSGGGVAMPLRFPLVFSTTTATHLELANGGNTPTPPVLTIRGPVANPSLDNDTTLESIRLSYVLGANDEIVVDVAARSVLLNGASRKDLIAVAQTKWWELVPGVNRIRARGVGMSLGQTLFTCQYRNARI